MDATLYELFSAASLLFICMIVALFLYITALTAWVHHKYDHLPGPKRTSFYLGNVSGLRSDDSDFEDKDKRKLKVLRSIRFSEWAELYGDTYVFFFLHHALVYTQSAEAIKTVLITGDQENFHKTPEIVVRFLYGERCMGDGLATAVDHGEWYKRRKIMDPLFHRNQLLLSVDAFNSTGDQLIEELHGYAESGETFKFNPILHLTTLDVIMKVMFSIDSRNLASDFHQASKNFAEVMFDGVQKTHYPLAKYNPYFYNHRKKVRSTVKSFRSVGAKLINERRTAILNGEHVPTDFLTTMVKASLEESSTYTFDVMLDEFLTIIVAGMETSANTLAFVFLELGRRPDLVDRLVHEVDDVVGKKAFVSNEDITKFSFMTTLIKESLRFYPPATGIVRGVRDESILDGLRIPAGSRLLISLFGANRHPKYLEDADKFNPDRFDSSQGNRVPVSSFTSFSLGARNCIGQVFAQMEMKVVLAKFFQHFEFKLDESENFEIGQSATLHPLSGLKCTVKVRA
ncbi:cholesterol 24-hydroxylase-like [Watersipora subatra]|uniref:cholesterol 24-hydroxylase-like n=1 Tax=Watersipora subatra TaxID=2589382 RepID=UPI00355C5C72